MAAKTTAQAGFYDVGATWTGGVVPADGDTLTINHEVTLRDARTVGHSPVAGMDVLIINAAFSIENGGSLKLRGDALQGNAAFTVKGGGIYEFDSSLAAAPATTRYKHSISSAHLQADAKFFTETGAIVRANAGGACGHFTGGQDWIRGGRARCVGTTFTRIGDDTVRAFDYDLNSASGDEFSLIDCTLDNCAGSFNGGGAHRDGTIFNLDGTKWINSSANLGVRFGSNIAMTSGTRLVRGCAFGIPIQVVNAAGFTFDGWNVFHEVLEMIGTPALLFEDCVLRLEAVHNATTTIKNSLIWYDNNEVNPHLVIPDGEGESLNFEDCIFFFTGTDGQGDCIQSGTPDSAGRLYQALRCIFLPNGAGDEQTGCVFTMGGNANLTVLMDHCTVFSKGDNSGIVVGEGSYPGHEDLVSAAKNSIIYGPPAGGGYIIYGSTDAPPVANIVDGADADYNCCHNLAADPYDVPTNGAVGVHDIIEDPNFVDPTRNPLTWSTSIGGPGTAVHAFEVLMADTSEAVNLLAYIRGGFIPQNPNVRTGAEDGTVMGAVQDAPPAAPSSGNSQRKRNIGIGFGI